MKPARRQHQYLARQGGVAILAVAMLFVGKNAASMPIIVPASTTLFQLSAFYGVPMSHILLPDSSPIPDPDFILAGERLIIRNPIFEAQDRYFKNPTFDAPYVRNAAIEWTRDVDDLLSMGSIGRKPAVYASDVPSIASNIDSGVRWFDFGSNGRRALLDQTTHVSLSALAAMQEPAVRVILPEVFTDSGDSFRRRSIATGIRTSITDLGLFDRLEMRRAQEHEIMALQMLMAADSALAEEMFPRAVLEALFRAETSRLEVYVHDYRIGPSKQIVFDGLMFRTITKMDVSSLSIAPPLGIDLDDFQETNSIAHGDLFRPRRAYSDFSRLSKLWQMNSAASMRLTASQIFAIKLR